MNATTRTMIFAGVALLSTGVAYVTERAMEPAPLEGFEKVGTEFYPDFSDPNKATALRVAAWNERRDEPTTFTVELRDGKWRIPSHHNYPAEGQQRLATTAASVVGVEREAVQSRRKADHERLGVLDPLDEEAVATRGRGKRITLFEGEKILTDYIIGNAVPGQSGHYYLRRPDEKETYIAELKVNLSTKFADWVEPDLLKLEQADLRRLVFSTPAVNSQDQIVDRVAAKVERESASGDWKLEGIDPETQEVDSTAVSNMVRALDDLELTGVRPKPKGINANLQLELPEGVASNPLAIRAFQEDRLRDLMSRGFGIAEGDDGQPRLYSREGELTASAANGAIYHLHFGNLFTGSIDEIEIGGESADAAAADTDAKPDDEGEANADAAGNEEAGEETAPDSAHRYLFVRVTFDESLVEGKPVKPTEPQKPAAPAEAPAEDDSPAESDTEAAEKTDDESPAADTPAGKSEDKPETEASAAEPAEKPDPQAEYEKAKQKYEDDLKRYQEDLRTWEEKVEAGRKKVQELNDRFANWYYVISNDSFAELKVSKEELAKPKEKPEEGAAENNPAAGSPPFGNPFTPQSPLTPPTTPESKPESQPESKPEPKPQPTDSPAPTDGDNPADSPDSEDNPKTSPAEAAKDEPAESADGNDPGPPSEPEKPAEPSGENN